MEGAELEEMLKKYIPPQKLQTVAEQKRPAEQDAVKAVKSTFSGLLDTALGIRYCGDSEEVYREVLTEFCDVETEDRQKIERTYWEGNWKDYAIVVHGLKSSALSVGAKKLSEEAAGLERAAKEMQNKDALHRQEVLAYIREYHVITMEMYGKAVTEGRRYLENCV